MKKVAHRRRRARDPRVAGGVLPGRGIQRHTAANGAEALARLQEEDAPCVVLLDLLMPVLGGNEVYQAMQKEPRLTNVPVIVMTSNPSRAPSGLLIMKKPMNLDPAAQHRPAALPPGLLAAAAPWGGGGSGRPAAISASTSWAEPSASARRASASASLEVGLADGVLHVEQLAGGHAQLAQAQAQQQLRCSRHRRPSRRRG